MDQFLLFGDSITQQAFSQDRGFAFNAALSDSYIRRLDVVNRGLSGYNTRQALHVLPSVMPPPHYAKVRLMTIFFGANDARLPNTPGGPQQHIPLDEFKQNTIAMITHPSVRAHEGLRLILITPPPVDERKALEQDRLNDPNQPENIRRKAAVTAQYAQAVRDIGKETHIPVLDIWSAMVIRAGGNVDDPEPVGSVNAPNNEILQSYLHDGLHMTPEGYKLLYTEMMALLAREYSDHLPNRLPFVEPPWGNQKAWGFPFSR